jgi:hypothetical protein
MGLARGKATSGLAKGAGTNGLQPGEDLVGTRPGRCPCDGTPWRQASHAERGPLMAQLGTPEGPQMGPSGGPGESPGLRDFAVELATSLARRGATLMFHVKQWNDNRRT